MNRGKLIDFEGHSVRITYEIMTGDKVCPHTRSGHLYAVTEEVVVFWPLNTHKRTEVRIPFKDVKTCELLNK